MLQCSIHIFVLTQRREAVLFLCGAAQPARRNIFAGVVSGLD
jgi:hypothetical protein